MSCMTTLYPPEFYADRRKHTAHAAARLLACLPPGLPRGRVADIGCGTGTWLATALAEGAEAAYGLEGDWVTPDMLDDGRIVFAPHDLEQPFILPPVDLVFCFEVAEHLSAERAPGFVSDLVALAPSVLFSAAIPGQGGVGHVNERWQSWWARLFVSHGYTAHDVIRPAVWTDDAIPAWYRQNTILYLAPGFAMRLALTATDPALLDAVHPAFWERANRELAYAGAAPESEVLRRRSQGID